MKKLILLLTALVFSLELMAQWVQIGGDIEGNSISREYGRVLSLNSDGTVVAIGSVNYNQVFVYEFDGSSWIQKGSTISATGSVEFGTSVSLNANGNILAIGAPDYSEIAGFVRVYEYDNSDWVQMGADINENNSYGLGYRTELNSDGTILITSSPTYDSPPVIDVGLVEVYQFNGNDWNLLGQSFMGEKQDDEFGYRVAINGSGNIIAHQSFNYRDMSNNLLGLTRVYSYDGNQWNKIGQDFLGEPMFGKNIGGSLALSNEGNIIVIGSSDYNFNEIDDGVVDIYEFNGATWETLGQQIIGDSGDDRLGASVAINNDGNIIAVGANQETLNPPGIGYTNVFKYLNGSWILVGSTIFGEDPEEMSGTTVELNAEGGIVAIGSPLNSDSSNFAGQVRVFGNDNILDQLNENYDSFSLFPNPTDGEITIEFNQLPELINVTIRNVIGQNVFEQNYSQISTLNLNLGLVQGVYFVSIRTDNRESHKKLIIE